MRFPTGGPAQRGLSIKEMHASRMSIQHLKNHFDLVMKFCEFIQHHPEYFPKETLENIEALMTHAHQLLIASRDAFMQNSDDRTLCEKYLTELLQFSRLLTLKVAENSQEASIYIQEYDKCMAALKHITLAVRLHFLLLDLTEIVKDQ